MTVLKLPASFILACTLLHGSAPQEPARLTLTPSQIAQYRKELKSPLVKTIRRFFNGYHSKNRVQAIDLVQCSELQRHPDAETKSRFVLALVEGNLFGGVWATIIFQAEPHTIINVWVKNNEVMAVADSKLPEDKKRQMIEMAADFLADPKFGI
jgi:hypothetical protein